MFARDSRALLQTLHTDLVVNTPSDKRAVARLTTLLERTEPPGDISASIPNRAFNESALLGIPAADAADVPLTESIATPPEFRVFRRESPVATPAVPASIPDWARSAAIAETIGPLQSADGRTFWFDFFRIVRLVPVYFAGDSQPAFLFHLRERRIGLADVIDAREVLGFIRQSRYTLASGSVWVRSNLFAAGAPTGSYVGLTVRGGTL